MRRELSDRQKKAAAAMIDTLHDFEKVARLEDLGTLGYLLQMARIEAQNVVGDEA